MKHCRRLYAHVLGAVLLNALIFRFAQGAGVAGRLGERVIPVPLLPSRPIALRNGCARSGVQFLAAAGAIGEIESVSHAFHPDGRLRASNSP